MLNLIIGALAPFAWAPAPNPTEACPEAAIVVVHTTQPTPCLLDGSQVLVLIGGSQASADQLGGQYLGFGLIWDADY
jgi:hypothetical protein